MAVDFDSIMRTGVAVNASIDIITCSHRTTSKDSSCVRTKRNEEPAKDRSGRRPAGSAQQLTRFPWYPIPREG
jgi:hypothetical protein